MIIIQQGTTNKITLPLTSLFAAEDLKTIVAIEASFDIGKNQVRKLWYAYDHNKSTMSFIKNTNQLNITISASENIAWKYQIPIQIRIKDKEGNTKNSNVFYGYIKMALSAEEF